MKVTFAIPGDLTIRNGGYGYNRQVMALLPRFGFEVSHLALPLLLPQDSPADQARAAALLADVPPDHVLLCDSLGLSPLSEPQLRAIAAPLVALVHHPISAELGLSGPAAIQWNQREGRALAHARALIVSSPFTASQLERELAVPAARITTAVPGTSRARRAPGSGSARIALLCVGSLIPRKGYDDLLTALATLLDLDWHLTIAGNQSLDPPYAGALKARLAAAPFAGRVTLHDELPPDALEALYQRADIFLMPSHFEGYGMALAESLARGLPIICTTGGAPAQTVPDSAGLKVPPADSAALREAIATLLHDGARRAALGAGSWQAGQALPDWPDTAARIAATLKKAA